MTLAALAYVLGLLVAGGFGLFIGMKLRGPATKRDLWMSEVRIIEAFGGIPNPVTVARLSKATDALKKAVAAAPK